MPNKTTQSIKEAIEKAFTRVGGVAYLEKLAVDDPRTFCVLVGKVIPLQIDASVVGHLTIHVLSRADVQPVVEHVRLNPPDSLD